MAEVDSSWTSSLPLIDIVTLEGEKDMLGEKDSVQQVMQKYTPHEGNMTPDDLKEGDLQDESGIW